MAKFQGYIDECEFAPRRTGLEDVVVVLMREQGGLLYREIKKKQKRSM